MGIQRWEYKDGNTTCIVCNDMQIVKWHQQIGLIASNLLGHGEVIPSKQKQKQQDCIPVWCVPPARWPYLPACSAPGGVPCPRGVPGPGGVPGNGGGAWSWGVCSRGCLLGGGGGGGMLYASSFAGGKNTVRPFSFPSPGAINNISMPTDICSHNSCKFCVDFLAL